MLQHRGAAGSGVAVVKLRVLPWHPTPLLRADPMKLLEAEPPRWVLSGGAGRRVGAVRGRTPGCCSASSAAVLRQDAGWKPQPVQSQPAASPGLCPFPLPPPRGQEQPCCKALGKRAWDEAPKGEE